LDGGNANGLDAGGNANGIDADGDALNGGGVASIECGNAINIAAISFDDVSCDGGRDSGMDGGSDSGIMD
jgi:hypothetical protein